MDELAGIWRVERVSGLLPAWPPLTKQLTEHSGHTRIGRMPIGAFRIDRADDGIRLAYRRWPILDRLERTESSDVLLGSGHVFGVRFCRFRLVRLSED